MPQFSKIFADRSIGEIISIVSGILSVIAFISGHIYAGYQVYTSNWTLNAKELSWYVMISNIGLLVTVGYITRAYIRRSKSNVRERNTIDELDKIIEKSKAAHISVAKGIEGILYERTGLTKHFTDLYAGNTSDITSLKVNCYQFKRAVLAHTVSIFTAYTGNQCACCIKLFGGYAAYETSGNYETDDISTLLRDDASKVHRSYYDEEVYKYHKNSAFWSIMDDPNADEYFFSNDLEALGDNYDNDHKGWRKHYNATAVFPIKPPDKLARDNAIGFLCVDNFTGNFDDDYTKHILATIANTLYYVLSGLEFIFGMSEPQQEGD